jgi:putative membrane protein
MRYLGWFLKLALFGFVLVLLIKNSDPVTVRFYLGGEWQAPLFLVLAVTFIAGVLLGVLALIFQVLRQRREISVLKSALRAPGNPPAG